MSELYTTFLRSMKVQPNEEEQQVGSSLLPQGRPLNFYPCGRIQRNLSNFHVHFPCPLMFPIQKGNIKLTKILHQLKKVQYSDRIATTSK